MNTCGTCKYFGEVHEFDSWDPVAADSVEIRKFHVCGLLKHLNGGDLTPAETQAQAAGAIDGSGYHAALCVSEEFGCIKWEPRS